MNQATERKRLRREYVAATTSTIVLVILIAYVLLHSALTSTPKIPLVSWPLPEPFKITSQDLKHGEKQVEHMVHDRPEMARYVNQKSPIWQWCARQFAGTGLGQHIYWNNSTPGIEDNGADHIMPDEGQRGSIRVSKTERNAEGTVQAVPCPELWRRAVYELNNMSNDRQFIRIYKNALAGRLTKAAWIEQNTRLEYLAMLKTEQVHEHLWKSIEAVRPPFTASREDRKPGSYEEWIAEYNNPTQYPWNSWGKYYDNEVIPCLKQSGIVIHE